MFTGIVKAVGRIAASERRGGDVRLAVRGADLPFASFDTGESIAVNGVCLTAVTLHADGFDTDVSAETLDVTTLGRLAVGSPVNLEPALALGERLGGHLVSGHVDCVGTVRRRESDARSIRVVVDLPRDYGCYVARKGSIAVDGVSLTVNEVFASAFTVNIIPHTADVTIVRDYAPGTAVNIEVDVVARYLERLLGNGKGELDRDFLRANGYD